MGGRNRIVWTEYKLATIRSRYTQQSDEEIGRHWGYSGKTIRMKRISMGLRKSGDDRYTPDGARVIPRRVNKGLRKPWTTFELSTTESMLALGHSPAEVAKALGTRTRNAVLGVARRHGWVVKSRRGDKALRRVLASVAG